MFVYLLGFAGFMWVVWGYRVRCFCGQRMYSTASLVYIDIDRQVDNEAARDNRETMRHSQWFVNFVFQPYNNHVHN